MDAVLLKTLPVKSPEELVALDSFNQRGERRNFSYKVFEQLRARTQFFSGVLASPGTSRMEMADPDPAAGRNRLKRSLFRESTFIF